MPDCKCTAIFTIGKWGWSESYYLRDSALDFDAVRSTAIRLISARTKLLGADVLLEGIRLAQLAEPKAVRWVRGKDINKQNNERKTDTLWEAALVRLATPSGRNGSRQLLLRGAPTYMVTDDPAEGVENLGEFHADWTAAFNKFKDELLGTAPGSRAWQLQVWKRDGLANVKQPVTSWTTDLNGRWTFVKSGIFEFNLGDQIVIGGTKGSLIGNLNGKAFIREKINASTYVIDKVRDRPASPFFEKNGFVRGDVKELVDITYALPMRWVIRKTGRAFFLTAGRAHNRG